MGDRIFRRLLTGTFNYGLGQILPQLIGFLLIPLYTLYLSPTDYGIFEICSSIIAFLLVFARFGVPGAVVRYYYDLAVPNELQKYVSTIYWFLLASSFCVSLLFVALSLHAGNDLFPSVHFYPFLLLTSCISFFSYSSDLQRRLLQVQEQSKYSAWLSIAFSLSGICLSIVMVVVFKMGAFGMLLAQLFNTFLFCWHANLYLRKWLSFQLDLSFIKRSLNYGTGLLPGQLLAAFAPLFAKSVLSAAGSLSALGIYSIAYRFVSPLTLLYTAFNAAFQPVFFSLRKRAEDDGTILVLIPRLLMTLWVISTTIFGVAILVMPPLMLFMVPIIYESSAPLIPILCWGFLGQVMYMLFTSEIFYQKKTRYMPFVTVTGTLVNMGLSYILVDSLGAEGLAWAASLAFIVMGIVGLFLFLKIAIYGVPWSEFISYFAVAILLSVVESHIHSESWPLRMGITSMFLLVIVFLNRQALKTLLGFIFR